MIETSSTIQTADTMSYQKAEPNFETTAPFDIASLPLLFKKLLMLISHQQLIHLMLQLIKLLI